MSGVSFAQPIPLDGPRRSLRWCLAENDALIISVARRDLRRILDWLDDHDRRAAACAALPVDDDLDGDFDDEDAS